jgi:hypothetical protein
MRELLAVHVEGPDDIIAVASREEGEKLVTEINQWQADLISSADDQTRGLYPAIHASVVPWEWGPSAHAEILIEQQEDEKRFQQVRTAKQKPEPK